MGSTTAYMCDGPKCTELVEREPGKRFPSTWPRLTLNTEGDATRSGSFHNAACAHAWLADKVPVTSDED